MTKKPTAKVESPTLSEIEKLVSQKKKGRRTRARRNMGDDNSQILKQFRKVARSYAESFSTAKNHIANLLGPTQNYSSGIFREGLLKSFLTEHLPRAVSIDSGFIYGFEEVTNSRQLDIIIWDSLRHSAVYKTREFVIVPPESVIAVISVKSNMEPGDVKDSLENLFSISPLEFAYRDFPFREGDSLCLPIAKFVVSYNGPAKQSTTLQTISEYYRDLLASSKEIAEKIIPVLQKVNPLNPEKDHVIQIRKVFPVQIAAIESNKISFLLGWGPPDDLFGAGSFGPHKLKRIPYIYPQQNKVTSPFEKFIHHILFHVYWALGTPGWSIISAWGDFNPVRHIRAGDADESIEKEGLPVLDPDKLASS